MLALSLNALHAQAGTINAASPALSDVSAAINNASDGDTVNIPAGSATWNSKLTLTKAISLVGAGSTGSTKTTITSTASSSATGSIIAINLTNPSHLCRVSGIDFEFTAGWYQSGGDHNAVAIYTSATQLRIDHNYIHFGIRAISIYTQDPVYGVADHNTFQDCDICISPGTTGGVNGTSWSRPVSPGGSDAFFFEDNQCLNGPATTGDFDEVMYGIGGGRCCFRHNIVDSTQAGGSSVFFDAHGQNAGWGDGTRFYEIYNNTIKYNSRGYRFGDLRGGTHLIHDNNLICSQGSMSIGMWSEFDNTPYQTQSVSKTFIWNNTINGNSSNLINAVDWDANDKYPPRIGTDVFNRPLQSGDPWYSYTPYIYPHPLVTQQGGGKLSSNPSPVQNVRVLASGS